jgi:hypothetical protein
MLNKSNQWLTLLANIGVVAGIVFLAFELQQNNKQLELQSYQSWVAANLEINAALTDPALSGIMARGHLNSVNLSNESFIAYAMLNMSVMQMAQSTDYLYRSGSLKLSAIAFSSGHGAPPQVNIDLNESVHET